MVILQPFPPTRPGFCLVGVAYLHQARLLVGLTSDYTVSGYLHGERITGFVQDITPFVRINSTSGDEQIPRG